MDAKNAKDVYKVVAQYADRAMKEIYLPALDELSKVEKSSNTEVSETARSLQSLLNEHISRLEMGLGKRGMKLAK